MKKKFRKIVSNLRSNSAFETPVVKFNPAITKKITNKDRLEYLESMVTVLECHPVIPEFKFNSDLLKFRQFLTYEILIRQLGHIRSFVANCNIYNHVGTAVAIRCMLEIYAFTSYLKKSGKIDERNFTEKLLYGSVFSSGELYEFENYWNQSFDEPLSDGMKNFLKKIFKTPHVNEYLRPIGKDDKGFDQMYALYSNYVHPTFNRPREQYLEDMGINNDDPASIFEEIQFYLMAQNSPSPVKAIEREIDVAGFCLELFYPAFMQLDLFYSEDDYSFSSDANSKVIKQINTILNYRQK